MKRSKLEIYVTVLEAFVKLGPAKITRVTYEANINHNLLKQIINSFLKSGLLEERKTKNRSLYVATAKAELTIKQFKEISQLFSCLEERIPE
jgi:predicted transcriptional regulator